MSNKIDRVFSYIGLVCIALGLTAIVYILVLFINALTN